MSEYKITIDAQKFKKILIHSWDLLSDCEKNALISIGIMPED